MNELQTTIVVLAVCIPLGNAAAYGILLLLDYLGWDVL